jgi:hypothetical protein
MIQPFLDHCGSEIYVFSRLKAEKDLSLVALVAGDIRMSSTRTTTSDINMFRVSRNCRYETTSLMLGVLLLSAK